MGEYQGNFTDDEREEQKVKFVSVKEILEKSHAIIFHRVWNTFSPVSSVLQQVQPIQLAMKLAQLQVASQPRSLERKLPFDLQTSARNCSSSERARKKLKSLQQ